MLLVQSLTSLNLPVKDEVRNSGPFLGRVGPKLCRNRESSSGERQDLAFTLKSTKNEGQGSAGIYLSWLGRAPQPLAGPAFVVSVSSASLSRKGGLGAEESLRCLGNLFYLPFDPSPACCSINTHFDLSISPSLHCLCFPLQELADFPLIPPLHILLDFPFSPEPARLILLSAHSTFCFTSFCIPVSVLGANPSAMGTHNPQPAKFGFTHSLEFNPELFWILNKSSQLSLTAKSITNTPSTSSWC